MHKTAKVTVITACVAALMLALITGVATRTSAQGPGTGGGPGSSLASQVTKLTAEVSTLQANYSILASTVTTLQTDVSKLDGNITAADLVGTYQLVQIQNELDTLDPLTGKPADIGAYVYTATVMLNANGTGSVTNYSQTGSYLNSSQGTLRPANLNTPSGSFDWMYASGVITLSNNPAFNGQTFFVGVGGRVLTHAASNATTSQANDSLIVATRLQ